MNENKRILVVDDRREVRMLISTALRNLPYDVIEASCGEDCLAMLDIKRPDLILLDILMPGKMNGLDVCRSIKERAEWSNIPIVIMTTMGQESDKAESFLAGADEYIIKPFSVEKLRLIVRQYFDSKSVSCGSSKEGGGIAK